jgi:hypothetical protein
MLTVPLTCCYAVSAMINWAFDDHDQRFPSPSSRTGAVPVAGRPTRRPWLLPALLGLLALIVVLFLLSRCDSDDTSTTGTTASPAAAPTTTTGNGMSAPAADTVASPQGVGQTGTGQAGQPGTVTAGDADLLASATAETLSAHDGRQAVARAVKVQSVPADEGFWIGANEQDRLWVQLTDTGGESDYKVKPGDIVDFTGTVTSAAQNFAADHGVTAAEGADQLTEQGHYLSAPASSVKLSD